MVRSTASRRAKNSDSVITVRRRPASLPSRRRCFLASRRVEPLTRVGSLLGSFGSRGVRTFMTALGATESTLPSSPARRRVRVRRWLSPSSLLSSIGRPRFASITGVGRSGAINISEVADIGAGEVATGAATTSVSADFLVARFAGAFFAAGFFGDSLSAASTSTAGSAASEGSAFAARFAGAFAGAFADALAGALAAALAGALRAGFFATADSSATGAFVSSFFTISGALQAACET